MRGSIIKRSRTSWSLVVDYGRDATTGKRKQKWVRFAVPRDKSQREAQKLAEAKLAALLHEMATGSYIDPSQTTFVNYLRDWHTKAVLPYKRPETARVYLSMIDAHVAKAALATMPLQKLRATDLEQFYATVKPAPSSINVLHAVVHRALKTAVRDRLITANPAAAVEARPRQSKDRGYGAREHCWVADEVRRVLAAAKQDGAQASAFFAMALDTGARKSELLGLTWADVNLDAGTVRISRQLEPRCPERPKWGPTKTGGARDVTLGAETLVRLRTHRKRQRELRLANAPTYQNHNLVFAKEPDDLQTPTAALGQPCLSLVERHFRRVVAAAGARVVKVHAMRHTAATLLLAAGVPVQVVAHRLGHKQVSMTLEVYAHALPDMQREAAAALNRLIYGAAR
jgi:integrase